MSQRGPGGKRLPAWFTAICSVVGLSAACTPKTPPDNIPELLTEVMEVPAVLPLGARGVRLAVTPDTATIDLRPLAVSLNEEERRAVRNAFKTVPTSGIRIQEGGSCHGIDSMLDFAKKLDRLKTADLEVHPDVTMLELANVVHCLEIAMDEISYRFILRGPQGLGAVDIDSQMGPVCRATDETPFCAGAYIRLNSQGLQIQATSGRVPTEPGCKHGVVKARLMHEPPNRPPPPWARKIMLLHEDACPTIPNTAKDRLGDLTRVIRELQRVGPGCPSLGMGIYEDIEWRQVAPVLATLRVSLESSVSIGVTNLNATFDCSNGLLVERLTQEAGHVEPQKSSGQR